MSQHRSYTNVTLSTRKRKPPSPATLSLAMATRAPRLDPEVRRRQLLDAALDVVTESGFDAVTVEAVAQRAGVTRPVVYDAFGDLERLMLALIDREEKLALTPLLEILGGDPGDVDPEAFLIESLRAFLRAVRSNPRTWRLVLMPPRGSSHELRARIVRSRRVLADRITALLEWGVARRGGPPELDHALVARLIVAAGEDAARLMLDHPRRFGPDRLAAVGGDLLALVPPEMRRRGEPVPVIPVPRACPSQVDDADASPAGGRVPQAVRREQLLDVTLELLAHDGFEALSMEAIARRAGVNRVVVYRSFPNLQVLLVALLRREDRRTREALDTLLPANPAGHTPPQLVGEALARFLDAVLAQPLTWRLALLRPESAPRTLQKLVERRRAQFARRLEPLVRWGLDTLSTAPPSLDVVVVARTLLSIGEEQGRLALDDPEFPPERLIASSWALLDAMPS
jgi:AcrR family transcriptional regulator